MALPFKRSRLGAVRAEPAAESAEPAPSRAEIVEEKPDSWWRFALRTLVLALLVFILFIATVCIVIPKVFGAVPLSVLSNSMAPAMPKGALAVVKPTMPLRSSPVDTLSIAEINKQNRVANIKVGDVVVYEKTIAQPVFVIHRVISTKTNADGTRVFTTKGDNNASADDEPVQGYQIRAVRWYVVPYMGWVNMWITNSRRAGIAITVAVAGYAWAMYLIISSFRKRKNPKRAVDQEGMKRSDQPTN